MLKIVWQSASWRANLAWKDPRESAARMLVVVVPRFAPTVTA